ncbi:unnamed protein product [Cyprideis torosa]|uniref:Uncharacterized protein n=1 Tax=Cyprideis torosa TaxID=163714 RepID=A0A7R8ZPD4_9CRUS|nr:unnamed protein product [Cyprideis torosa]CAG0888164.1 unnamed protein product [Cyprideis torosa]
MNLVSIPIDDGKMKSFGSVGLLILLPTVTFLPTTDVKDERTSKAPATVRSTLTGKVVWKKAQTSSKLLLDQLGKLYHGKALKELGSSGGPIDLVGSSGTCRYHKTCRTSPIIHAIRDAEAVGFSSLPLPAHRFRFLSSVAEKNTWPGLGSG